MTERNLKEIEELASRVYPQLIHVIETNGRENAAWKAFGYAAAFLKIRDEIKAKETATAKKFWETYG